MTIELTKEGKKSCHLFEAGREPHNEPQAWHRVEAATDDVEWYLEFYCEPRLFPKKYNTNHPIQVLNGRIVPAGKALDLGCGQGRNASFWPNMALACNSCNPKMNWLLDFSKQ